MTVADMRLVMEGEFWSQLLGFSEIQPEENTDSCERGVVQQMMALKRLMFLTRRICPQAKAEIELMTEPDFAAMYRWLDNETHALILKELTETLEAKSNVLKHLASNVKLDKDDQLVSLALTSFDFDGDQKQSSQHLCEALTEAQMSYVITRMKVHYEKELKEMQTEVQIDSLDCPNCPQLREATRDLESKLADLQCQPYEASLKSAAGPQTLVQIEGEPIDSLDKSIELHDMIARHRKELREVKDCYEQEAEKLRKEIVKAGEALRVLSEENVKEIDSLTNCMENLKKKYETERTNLMERFDQEMEELRRMMSLANPDNNLTDEDTPPHRQTSTLKERIQELVTQVSVMTQEMRRRKEQEDITTLRMKYEKDLENLKVEALLVLAVLHL